MTTPSLSESYTLSGSDTASPDIVNKMIYESLSPPPDFADLDISGNHNLNQGKEDNGTNGEETDELASSHTSPNPPLGAVLPMFSSSPLQYSDDMDVDKENGTDKEAQNEDVPLDEESPFKYFSQELVNLLTNSPSIHEDEDNLPDVKNLHVFASQPITGKEKETKFQEIPRHSSILRSPISARYPAAKSASLFQKRSNQNLSTTSDDEAYSNIKKPRKPLKRRSSPLIKKNTKKRPNPDREVEIIDLDEISTPPPPDRNSRVSQTQHIIKQSLSQSPQSSRPAPRRPVPSEEPVSKKRRQTTGTAAAPRVSFNLTAPTVTPRRKVSASQPPILSDRDEDTSTSVISTPPRRRSLISEDKQGTPLPNPPIDPEVSQSTPSSTPRVLSHRHPDFWFLDGSIVLRLGKTVFRVHKSQMVSKSPFFIDLFHEETSEMMDGCPVYELPSDMNITVLDFSRLLKANYNAFKYIRKSPSFQILSSLLRASVAFKFEDIKEWALEEFKRMWDSDVKAVKGKRPHARESVVLARAVKGLADKVLKPALYEIIKMPRLGMDVLEDGESFPGSSRTEVINVDASDEEESQVDTLGHQLTWNDIGRLVYAREQMAMEWNRYALRATSNCKAHIPVATPLTCPNQNEPTPPIAETPKTRECGEYFRSQWPELVHESGIFEDHLHDPIGGLSELLEVSANWEKNRVWCSSCATSNRQHWKKGKEKLWDCLDVWLELGN